MTRQKQSLITAAMAIAAMAFMALYSAIDKAPTFDEPVHIAGGAAALEHGDFRLNPENGILPQVWEAAPLLLLPPKTPIDTASRWWPMARKWDLAAVFLFRSGNDHGKILLLARFMVVLLGAFCAAAVFVASRQIWGSRGAAISVALFALSPTVLANTRLATSDMAAALFFILSVWTFQAAMDKLTIPRFAAAAAATAALFLSKMSAPIVIPTLIIVAATRIIPARPWRLDIPGYETRLRSQAAKSLAALLLLAAIGIVVFIAVWGAFRFRYSMLSDGKGAERLDKRWEVLLANDSAAAKTIGFAKRHKLFPEAYLYGYAYVFRESRERHAFLNGRRSSTGWWYFFPATFAMKTPPEIIALILLGVLIPWLPPRRGNRGSGSGPRFDRRKAYLWKLAGPAALVAVYLVFSMTSHLNIGHRHLLPIYPPLFIAAGGAAILLRRKPLPGKLAVAALLAALAMENILAFPDYLAYFSPLAGGSENGYRHLVDSSLDWGQDLANLKRWVEERKIPRDKVYIAYFGSVDLKGYGIPYRRLQCCFEQQTPETFRLKGGIYCLSATMLQMTYRPDLAEWTPKPEAKLKRLRKTLAPLLDASGDKNRFAKVIAEKGPARWTALYREYETLRFAKLAAALRKRPPDETIGHSILIYRLSDRDLGKILGD